MRVLIADDDLTSRLMLQANLTKIDFDVTAVADGEAALKEMTGPDAPRLAVLDWMMPGLSGPEVCRKLRAEPRDCPTYIILLTSKDSVVDLVEGLKSGADDFVTKPVAPEELRARMDVGRRVVEMQAELAERGTLRGVLEMAGAVCHELNQPLQSISTHTDLLLMEGGESDSSQESIQEIKKSVKRLGVLTRKIMSISQYRTKDYLSGQIVDIDEAVNTEDS